ncbi:MAG: TMEM175 family protein [bacterium]
MIKGRLEAFSDGVIAILITIMVLELKVPHGTDVQALRPLVPVFLTYTAERINGRILWANMHLLFWLSLVPFVTGWMGENHFAPLPTAVYGGVLLMAAVAWTILQRAIIAQHGRTSKLASAVGRDAKGKLSAALYVLAIPLAFVNQWISDGIYVFVALMWFIPDRRIEALLKD